jgi:hypothetical protein
MGTWDSSILGNDTSCQARERFFELYDSGEDPKKIASIILEELSEVLEHDRTNVWLGLAMACWECKVLTKSIFAEAKKIVDSKEDIEFSKKLKADEDFLKKRQKELLGFIKKISKQKTKPRARKTTPKQVASIYAAGMCLAYKNINEKYIGIYITESEHFKDSGKIVFYFLDFESKDIPTLAMCSNSKLYGLKKLGKEWGNYEYQGNVTNLYYDKNTKEDFFNYVPKTLLLIGKLEVPNMDRLSNNFRGDFMYLNNPPKMVASMESMRLEGKREHKLSTITLSQLLGKVGL